MTVAETALPGGHGRCIQRVDVDIHAGARMNQIGQRGADQQGKRGNDFKVDNRLDTNAADFLQVAGAGHAADHHTKYDGGNDHLDQFEKTVAERTQAFTEMRKKHTDDNADKQPNHNTSE